MFDLQTKCIACIGCSAFLISCALHSWYIATDNSWSILDLIAFIGNLYLGFHYFIKALNEESHEHEE
jgi:hypothetical protein